MKIKPAGIVVCSLITALMAFGFWPPTASAEITFTESKQLPPEKPLDQPTQSLVQAVNEEEIDPDRVKELIAQGASVNAVYDFGRTILTTAIKNNAPLQIIKILLDAGADPNLPGHFGHTPLMLSTQMHKRPTRTSKTVNGQTVQTQTFFGPEPQPEATVFLTLLAAGADPNQKNERGETAGFNAAANPNPVFIKSFLEAGGRLDLPNEYGQTILMEAAYYNPNSEIIDLLLQAGARVDRRDQRGFSPLHYAAGLNPSLKVSQVLLAAGADPQAKTDQGMSPVFMAAANPNLEVIRTLIKAGGRMTEQADDGMTMLMLAAGHNTNPEMVAFLIEAGEKIEATDKDGASAIHHAAKESSSEGVPILRALVEAGADLNLADHQGWTAWHYAIPGRVLNDFHQALLDLGADVNRADHNGLTPLLLSTDFINSDKRMLPFLLQAGADPKAVDKNGRSAVMLALSRNIQPEPELIEALLKAGADPSLPDATGQTPLIRVVTGEHITRSALELLLKNGADANGRDAAGNSPLHYAAASDPHYKAVMAEDLLEAGADPDAANHLGQTPLMWAANKREHPGDIFDLLLAKGARLEAKSNDGRSVLDWASSNTNPAVAETLKKLGVK